MQSTIGLRKTFSCDCFEFSLSIVDAGACGGIALWRETAHLSLIALANDRFCVVDDRLSEMFPSIDETASRSEARAGGSGVSRLGLSRSAAPVLRPSLSPACAARRRRNRCDPRFVFRGHTGMRFSTCGSHVCLAGGCRRSACILQRWLPQKTLRKHHNVEMSILPHNAL